MSDGDLLITHGTTPDMIRRVLADEATEVVCVSRKSDRPLLDIKSTRFDDVTREGVIIEEDDFEIRVPLTEIDFIQHR